jgi:hypothetical protein
MGHIILIGLFRAFFNFYCDWNVKGSSRSDHRGQLVAPIAIIPKGKELM